LFATVAVTENSEPNGKCSACQIGAPLPSVSRIGGKRSRNGVLDSSVDGGAQRIVGEALLPPARCQSSDVASWMTIDAL
jgi:hypothetical protein